MEDVHYSGDPEEVMAKLMNLGSYLSGEIPDPTGAIKDALVAVGLAVLHNIHEHFDKLSQGGVGDDGTVWEHLSVVTLALRRKDTGIKSVERIVNDIANATGPLSSSRRRLFLAQSKRMKSFYEHGANGAARRRALKLLETIKPYISKTRYNKTKKELEAIGTKRMNMKRLKALAYASGAALILRDTGDLFNSLEPYLGAIDQLFEIGPGWVDVGTMKDYAKYHQSPEPRKLKADGTPILPRRAFLPDIIPQFWYDDAITVLREILGSHGWMVKFLGSGAR